jgi:hypothetical protein
MKFHFAQDVGRKGGEPTGKLQWLGSINRMARRSVELAEAGYFHWAREGLALGGELTLI